VIIIEAGGREGVSTGVLVNSSFIDSQLYYYY